MIKQSVNIFSFLLLINFLSCADNNKEKLFTRLDHADTGIEFQNTLFENENLNVLNYVYFYNGGGVATGDINNDGLPDILFTGNMVKNRLYLNKGNFKFENITDKSGIADKQGWCSGATMADINGDGNLDIYICRSADAGTSMRKNLLFINNGDLSFTESAEAYGLANNGYSTQASFFDYDKDGDLDMFLINHSLQQYTTGAVENPGWRKQTNAAFECKLYRNEGNISGKPHPVYADVTAEAGITSNVLTFGLGVAVSDVNNDGWPDVYVSNDFNEHDYLFINNGDGTFTDKLAECMDEVSLYSMGSDATDFNNDGLIDLVTLDMLPEDNRTQKMHSGAENFDKFQMLFKLGFYYQYSRNMLQKNNGDGTFSEIGQLAGISNTDWSWAALLSDFDNDGNKDLLATTGYVKDYTDMDFIKYSVDLAVKQRSGQKVDAVKEYINKMPVNHLISTVFKNNGNNTFTKSNTEWGFDHKTVAAGAAYADLNNDGNLDIIINNINDYAGIYKNNGSATEPNHYLKINLKGNAANSTGIGTKVKLFCRGQVFYQEQVPVRGYQSSVDHVLNFGIGKHAQIDSIQVVWPNDQFQVLRKVPANQLLSIDIKEAEQKWQYGSIATAPYLAEKSIMNFTHKENDFSDFTVQHLLPNYLSRQGPSMAKADVNTDGRDDLFIGGAKGQPGQLFIQTATGTFAASNQTYISNDSLAEDVSAIFFDANGDGHPDLYVGSGGYEFAEKDILLQDRLYINSGKGSFVKAGNALPQMITSTGCVKAADIDGDGDMDLFVGGRVVPGKYPIAPESYVLLNDGKGNFTDEASTIAPSVKHIGMVTDALWTDLNKDGKPDLIIVGEWMPVKVFINTNGKLEDASAKYIPFASSGWWNKILADDFDGDGDADIIIGNLGSNAQFRASEKEPLSIYYKDFDGNGSVDPIFCYYINGVSYPAASRDDLLEQLPVLKKKFNDYSSYANATINGVFSEEQLKDAGLLNVELLSTVYLQNNGDSGFAMKPLPQEAQYAPIYAMVCADFNADGKKDILLAGNNAWTRIKFGRYRANHGAMLIGDGKGGFSYLPQYKSGLKLRGDTRFMDTIHVAGKNLLLVGMNNTSLVSYIFD
ncbi:VCBS repeat-containing protein [Agriterribacter sp.]|uniref:VCBS repeat-containing protein n=1 Tax=Agriterribacter sp. TaxID=2821509 RepID=UPI002BC0D1F2|nr:VCBS repeat-containing protein [Agriterribacter sp.]HRP55746.1 VCBS repeat-containing protein [Agriterribacter sp.]